jgi:hypothetical protein
MGWDAVDPLDRIQCEAAPKAASSGPFISDYRLEAYGTFTLQVPISFQGLPLRKLIPVESLYLDALPVGESASRKKVVPAECKKYGMVLIVVPELRLTES